MELSMISKIPHVTLLGSGKISKVVYHYVCKEWQINSFAIEKAYVKNIEIVSRKTITDINYNITCV